MSRLRTPDTPDYPRQRRWGSGAGAGAHPPSSSSPPASSVAISPSARRAVSPLRDVGSPSWSSPERLSQRTHTASVRSLEGQVAALNRVIEDRPADTLHVTHDMQGEGLVELRNELLRDPGLPQLTGENAHACRGVRTGITRIVSAQLARWADAWEDNHNYQRMHAVFQKQMDETLAAEHARWEQNAAAMIRDQIEAANLGFRGELARVDRRVEDVMQSIAHSDNEAEARTAALWSAIDELRNKAKGNDAVQYAKDTAHTLQSQLENLAADVSDRMAKLHNEAQQIKQQVNRGDSSRDMQWVKTEMQRLEDDVNSQGDALSHLQKDVSDSKQRDSAVQKHMQWVKAEMQRLDGDMHSQGDALADLQNDVSDSKQRDSAVQKTMQAMQEDLHRLAREVRESTASAEAATAAVQDMEVELRELAKHLQHLLKQSKRPQPDGDVRRIKAELERDSAEMEAAVGEVRDTMKQLEQRVAVLERGAKDMPGRAVVKALQQNVDSLDGSTKRRMDQLEQLIRDLRDTTSAHDVRLRTLESTAREVDELRALLHNLEAARSNSPTTPPEDTAAASRKLSAMRAELDKVRSDVNGCMTHIDTVEDNGRALERKVDSLAADLMQNDLRAQLDKVKRQLEESVREVAHSVKQQGTALGRDIENCKSDARDLRDSLTEQIRTTSDILSDLSNHVDNQLDDITREHDRWRDRVSEVEVSANETKGFVKQVAKDLDTPMSEMHARILALESSVETSLNKFRRQNELVQKENKSLKDVLADED